MGKFTMTHEINADADTFWKVFLDKEFNEKLYTGPLGFPEFKVVEQNETDTGYSRKVAAMPKMDVPGAVQKLIGSGFRYTEEGTMAKSERVWRWKMTPSTLADKLFTSGLVRLEPLAGGSKVRRIADMNVEAKIFGVGGLIEGTAEKQMREGWDKSAAFMNKWLAEHPAT
jgi:Protein of unknown function (DUF2505)